jgi:hypothetical protein
MKYAAGFAGVCLALLCSVADAGGWADGLFNELRHDFGNIPHGADVRCNFVITNTTGQPIRIGGMKRSCGCTEITLDDKVVLDQNIQVASIAQVLAPGQQATIGVVLDTVKFLGNKAAEILVTFDYPSLAEVRLTVNSFIRQDIVFNPAAIQFGTVSRGQELTKELDIEYAGQLNWQIQGVVYANSHLNVTYDELYRKPGQVGYRLKVAVKPTAPAGSLRELMIVETNDPGASKIPVLIDGQLQSDLVITPSNFNLGSVRTGESAARQILLRAKKPFEITKVEGPDAAFQVEKSAGKQAFHKLTVRFTAPDQVGPRECTFRIETDLADQSAAELKATVQVVR